MKRVPTQQLSKKLYLDDLTVTQHGLRNERQIRSMVGFVAEGGRFDLASLLSYNDMDLRLISIVRFEDGRLFIHDGHHRVASIYLGGRKYVHETEYSLSDWTHEEYRTANLEVGWVTPFDPRTECRIADYEDYKNSVFRQEDDSVSQETILAYVQKAQQKDWYKRPRACLTVKDLLRQLWRQQLYYLR